MFLDIGRVIGWKLKDILNDVFSFFCEVGLIFFCWGDCWVELIGGKLRIFEVINGDGYDEKRKKIVYFGDKIVFKMEEYKIKVG